MRSVQWNHAVITGRLSRLPKCTTRGAWGSLSILDARRSNDGETWIVGRKMPLYIWANDGDAARALLQCAKTEIVQVEGRLKVAIWRHRGRTDMSLGIQAEAIKSLGFAPFFPHQSVSRGAMRRRKEMETRREREAEILNRDEIEARTQKLLDSLRDPI